MTALSRRSSHSWTTPSSAIAVRGDVIRYINLLQDVNLVIKHGKRYK